MTTLVQNPNICSSDQLEKFQAFNKLIGNTPMLELQYHYNGKPGRIYVKCEYYNLSGSIKDRMALHILQQAYEDGQINKGAPIVEATYGNTGLAFAALGRAFGHPVQIIMPDRYTREWAEHMQSMGAEVKVISQKEGGLLRGIQLAGEMAVRNPNIFLPRQFMNRLNCEAHERTTGPEIWNQLQRFGKVPDAFVAGVGTGGTIMGVGAYLRRNNPNIRLHPLEPFNSPTLSTGYKAGLHRIQGIADGFVPPILQLDKLDEVVQVRGRDAIRMGQKLAKQLGLGVGFSSGANIIGAIQLQQEMGPDSTVVTVLPDSNKKYLNTDLLWEQPFRKEYTTSKVEFLDYFPLC